MGILDDAPPEKGSDTTASTVQQDSLSGDIPPKKRRGRPPGSKNKTATQKSETEKIAKALGMILAMPALPAQMVGDEWLMGHFNTAGPQLATILAESSERNPVLRAWLLRAMAGESVAVLAIGVIGYIVPPTVYFMTPVDSPLRTAFNVPNVPAPRRRQQAGGEVSNNGTHPESAESAWTTEVPIDSENN